VIESQVEENYLFIMIEVGAKALDFKGTGAFCASAGCRNNYIQVSISFISKQQTLTGISFVRNVHNVGTKFALLEEKKHVKINLEIFCVWDL